MVKHTCISVLLAVSFLAGSLLAQRPEEVAATRSAEAWLGLVDQGRYAESYRAAARIFQQGVAEGKWKEALGNARPRLGKLISRRVQSAQYTTSLPGGVDGRFVVIQFATSFENKKAAVETVTPTLDEDGVWRVSGYYIR